MEYGLRWWEGAQLVQAREAKVLTKQCQGGWGEGNSSVLSFIGLFHALCQGQCVMLGLLSSTWVPRHPHPLPPTTYAE